jgi:hypothetical protein
MRLWRRIKRAGLNKTFDLGVIKWQMQHFHQPIA